MIRRALLSIALLAGLSCAEDYSVLMSPTFPDAAATAGELAPPSDMAHNLYVDSLPAGVSTNVMALPHTTGSDTLPVMTSQSVYKFHYAAVHPTGSSVDSLALKIGGSTLFSAVVTASHWIRDIMVCPRPERNTFYVIRYVSTGGTFTSAIDSVPFSDWANPHSISLTIKPSVWGRLLNFEAFLKATTAGSGSAAFSLPIASPYGLGGVKIASGSGLSVDGGGFATLNRSFRAITATRDTIKNDDVVLGLSGGTPDTIQLPTMQAGHIFRIKRTDGLSTLHVILGTIDGAASYVFSWPYESIELCAITSSTFAIVGGR